MRELGRIVRLQIQRSSLKTGEKPQRVYDPSPLLSVDCLAVGPDGVLGHGGGGAWLVDVHHRAHPETKNEDGAHGVSLGFTSHYGAMHDRFGDRITIGCAGENIIVETAGRVTWPCWAATAGSLRVSRCSRWLAPAVHSQGGRSGEASRPRC